MMQGGQQGPPQGQQGQLPPGTEMVPSEELMG